MIKVSDYVVSRLVDIGVRHVFLVTGGGAMHLNDSIGKEHRIKFVCNHHEQACAMAAEAYARVLGKIGVINVTTGPGGVNALNGVYGAWTDSIPMLILSGQVKRETCMVSYNIPGLRQLGDQEADILSMVKGITKYAVLVNDPESIKYHLDRAVYVATSGRQGPCWLDIPIDVQGSMIDERSLIPYDPSEDQPYWHADTVARQCEEVIDRIKGSPRPVILVGSGVRLAGAEAAFEKFIDRLGIPVTPAWTALDLVGTDGPLYCGRPGMVGDRAGNFTVQNAETLLTIGCRLHLRQISYNWQSFARHAYKIQVDADPRELDKPTVKPDMAIHCDAKVFLDEMNRQLEAANYRASDTHKTFLSWCRARVAKYPVLESRDLAKKDRINPYYFMHALFEHLGDDDIVACGNGAASVIPFQVARIRKGQRVFTNAGAASMGYDLPAAIGAAFAQEGKRVICLAGDGSIQMNIQELQTIAQHRLPVKIFVINNGGYLSIRTTQLNFFGRLTGEGPKSGLTFPDIVNVAAAYGLPSLRLQKPDFQHEMDEILSIDGPVLCEVVVDPDQQIEPKLSSKQLPDGRIVSPPLEDMYPFLDREELLENMLIPPMDT